jgi:hypothetical protein
VRGRVEKIRPRPGTDLWWQEQRGRTDSRGAGVTGTVIIDGVGFQLPGHTPLPSSTVNEVGGLLAAALQNDPDTFTGYSHELGGIY